MRRAVIAVLAFAVVGAAPPSHSVGRDKAPAARCRHHAHAGATGKGDPAIDFRSVAA